MKSKWTVFLIAFILITVTITLLPIHARAQGQNLLKNPGFEEGHYNQDGIVEITVPNDWRMHWSNRESNIFGGYAETARPETVVWNISGAPDHERDLFWKDGNFTVKIFKGWAPMWAAMSQDVGGLEVGRRYRLVAPVYIDMVAEYVRGQKVAPVDGRQGRVRLGASPVGAAWRDEANINYSGWWTGENISPFYLAYPTFIHEFTATAPEMTVWIEVASNYPHPNNGFFIDTVGLYALEDVDQAVAAGGGQSEQPQAAGGGAPSSAPPAAPLPTPTPRADGAVVHIVQSGDSFWSLAIQYAETMGLTAEEALQAIPELNNNPLVISTGMELIIVPPSEGGQAVADAPADANEGAGETTESESATQPDEGDSEEAADATTGESEQEASDTTDTGNSRSPIAEVLPQVSPGSICVQVFEDINGDAARAEQDESPMSDQAITLSQSGNTITTYITDGSSEMHCFENLETGTYQVQIFPTADYMVTGDDSWAVAIAEGVMIPVSFGLQLASDAVAEAGEQAGESTAETSAEQQEPSSGLSNNLGMIALGGAVLLIILAGAGVYLLRRG